MKTTDPISLALKNAVISAIDEKKLQLVEENIILDVKEAATYLKVSVSTVRSQMKDGELPHYWVSGQIRFLKRELTQWLISKSR